MNFAFCVSRSLYAIGIKDHIKLKLKQISLLINKIDLLQKKLIIFAIKLHIMLSLIKFIEFL